MSKKQEVDISTVSLKLKSVLGKHAPKQAVLKSAIDTAYELLADEYDITYESFIAILDNPGSEDILNDGTGVYTELKLVDKLAECADLYYEENGDDDWD